MGDARAVHARAKGLLESEDPELWQRAWRILRVARRAHPGAEPLHRLEGVAAHRLGKRAAAEASFRRALELAPEVAYSHLELASLLACGGGRPAEAEALLAAYLSRHPADHGTRLRAAQLFAACGPGDLAVSLYLDLVGRDPVHAWVYQLGCSQVYHDAGRYQEAWGLLGRALASGPRDHPALLAQAGATLQRLGRTREALRFYREALRHEPEPALAEQVRTRVVAMEAAVVPGR